MLRPSYSRAHKNRAIKLDLIYLNTLAAKLRHGAVVAMSRARFRLWVMSGRVGFRRFGSRIAAVATALLLFGAASLAGATAAAAADLNDFVIDSFAGEYQLGVDESGRSSLRTTEHIVAIFPDYDQNRGLRRDLVRVYDGHDTSLQLESVTDENGRPRDYTTETNGDYLTVTIAVPEGQYVHGAQHYVLEYTQRDVTRHFEDTAADEFYWDINGTGWQQPFGTVTATVKLDDSLANALSGARDCYRGAFGEANPCEIIGGGTEFTAEATGLAPEENMSIAIGFTPGTFAAAPTPPVPFLQRVPLLLWAGPVSLAAALATFITALVRGRTSRTGRAIIAQYEPPQGVNAATAAELWRARKKGMTATLLDLAVRRKIRLLRDEPMNRYGVESIDATELDATESWVYERLFDGRRATSVDPGTREWFTQKSTKLGDTASSLSQRVRLEMKKQGLVRSVSGAAIAWVIAFTVLSLTLPLIHSIVFGQFVMMTLLLAVGINVLVWTLFGMIAALTKGRRLTREGALLLDHLKGLREYIRLAEADRIRVLQSVSGVEVDEQFIVRVYERLLPYAVIFGFEKEWQGELERYYRESTPDWFAGEGVSPGAGPGTASFTNAFPITTFASSVASSPTAQSTASFSSAGSGSGSSFSSFSGGSSGGGFSGGGGGGGGGGGV